MLEITVVTDGNGLSERFGYMKEAWCSRAYHPPLQVMVGLASQSVPRHANSLAPQIVKRLCKNCEFCV